MPVYDINGNIIGGGDSGDTIQPYFQTELNTTVASVRAAQSEPCLTFAVVTDVHYNSNDKIVFPHTIQNIKAFSKQVRLDGILCLGDMTDGNKTQSTTIGLLNEIMPPMRNIGLPVFFTAGNHDCNAYGSSSNVFSTAQAYQYYYTHGANDVFFDEDSWGVNFYKDYDQYKIRLISLDAANTDSGSTPHYKYPASTVTWFVNTALATVPTGYAVLMETHLSPIKAHNWNNTGASNATNVINAINTWVGNGNALISFIGHSHADFSFTSPYLEIAINSNLAERTEDRVIDPSIDTTSFPAGTITKLWAREIGTVTEDCWDVAVIKPKSKVINMIRFGAGEDRSFTY